MSINVIYFSYKSQWTSSWWDCSFKRSTIAHLLYNSLVTLKHCFVLLDLYYYYYYYFAYEIKVFLAPCSNWKVPQFNYSLKLCIVFLSILNLSTLWGCFWSLLNANICLWTRRITGLIVWHIYCRGKLRLLCFQLGNAASLQRELLVCC